MFFSNKKQFIVNFWLYGMVEFQRHYQIITEGSYTAQQAFVSISTRSTIRLHTASYFLNYPALFIILKHVKHLNCDPFITFTNNTNQLMTVINSLFHWYSCIDMFSKNHSSTKFTMKQCCHLCSCLLTNDSSGNPAWWPEVNYPQAILILFLSVSIGEKYQNFKCIDFLFFVYLSSYIFYYITI